MPGDVEAGEALEDKEWEDDADDGNNTSGQGHVYGCLLAAPWRLLS